MGSEVMTEVDPSSRLPPWPPQWPVPQPGRYVSTIVFLALFGLVAVAAGVSFFLPAFDGDGVYLLVVAAPLLFGVAGIVVITRLRLRDRSTTDVHSGHIDEVDEDGLVIPYSRSLGVVYVVILAVSLLFFAAIAVASVVALTDEFYGGLAFQSVVMLGFSLYLARFVVDVARKRLVRGSVVLTPNGIYHRSWAFDSFLTWEQIESVSAGRTGGQLISVTTEDDAEPQVRSRSLFWKQPEYKQLPHTAISGRYLSIDPALAFHTLRFYGTTPEARPELGTDTAIQRLRDGDVVTRDLGWV
jgi:hypothetical protein